MQEQQRPAMPAEKGTESDLDSVINEIYGEKLNQNNPYNVIDIAEAVESLANDIYSENKRFIYELIQNADDAAILDESELSIVIKSGFAVLSHNGKPFDEWDLRGLCGIGRGTKRDDGTKTGYKGIGFKSVFGQPDGLVFVKSKDLLFRFDKTHIESNGWNIEWGNQAEWEKKNRTQFKSPWQLIPILSVTTNNPDVDGILNSKHFTVKTAIKIRDEAELSGDIKELFLDARFLLFLRKIHKVTFIHESRTLCIRRESEERNGKIVRLYINDVNVSNWYLKTESHEIPNFIKKEMRDDSKSPKKLQEMVRADLSFAFKVGPELTSIIPLPSNESEIFTYLPTSVREFGFPFLVNSNFLVDAGREKLHKDRIWNKWLFETMGYELLECCKELASSEQFKNDYLKVLLPRYLNGNDHLKNKFDLGMRRGFEEVSFVRNEKGELVRLRDIFIDETGITGREIIDDGVIIDFINSNQGDIVYLRENIIKPNPGVEKLIHYGARTFSEKELKDFLQTESFFRNLKIESNCNLLEYLMQLDRNDPSGQWHYIIRNHGYIFANNDTLVRIPLTCFPISNFSTEFGGENTLINASVYESISENPDLIEWLKELGVKEPSELSYLEQEIIGKIDTCINEQNHLIISEFIMKLHKDQKLKEEHYTGLRTLSLKTDSGMALAKDCVLPFRYDPLIDFASNIDDALAVSEGYIGKYNAYEWKTLFVRIGVADDINILTNYMIQKSDIHFSGLFFEQAVRFGKEGHTYPHLVHTDPPYNHPAFVTYFTFFSKTTKFSFSSNFWERLTKKYSISIEPDITVRNSYGPDRVAKAYKLNSIIVRSIDTMRWGYYSTNRVCIPSYISWQLSHEKCIPTNQKECMLASDVFTNSPKIIEIGGEYIPIINVSKELSREWNQFIGLKTKLRIDDILHILTAINNDKNEKGRFKKDNVKKLGLLYNEIISRISELSIQEEAKITQWAKTSRFVCNDYLSRINSEAIWLRLDGFSEYDDKIPSILIPRNVNIDENAEKLFSMFGIPIVDECEHRVREEIEEQGLTIKVLELLPALALILRSKLRVKDELEYLENTYKGIAEFKFFICKEIQLVLVHKGTEIRGSHVNHYLSDKAFFFTKNWKSPLERFRISHFLSTLLKCTGLGQEIQLLMELSEAEAKEYLSSIGIDISRIENSDIYKMIQARIRNLRDKSSPKAPIPGSPLSTVVKTDVQETKDKSDVSGIVQTDQQETDSDFREEVRKFIEAELEGSEWSEHIPDLKNMLEVSIGHSKEKQKIYNLIAKIRLSKATGIRINPTDKIYNQLISGDEKYFVHSARGSFAYIHTLEIIRMRDEGFKMALDFGSHMPLRIYNRAEDILSLNRNHLLAFQHEKTMDQLFTFCENNKDENKHLLVIDRDVSNEQSTDIFKLLNADDDYR